MRISEKWKAKLARGIPKEDESALWRRRILEGNKLLTDTFADKVEAAKREVRAWRRRAASRKRDFWSPRATEVAHEKPERKKKEVGADESPVRYAEKGRSDFRQLAETSTAGWEYSGEEKTSLTRKEKRAATESHLEKYTREAKTYPPSETATSELSTAKTTTTSTPCE